MFANGSGLNEQSSFGQAVSEEKIVYESTNQQHELPVLAMFPNGSKISNLYSEHRELYSNMGMRIEYTIFLMMRLKFFRPEVDKSWQSRRECQK